MSDGVKLFLRVLGSIALGFLAFLLSNWVPPFWVGMTVVVFLGLSILSRLWELGDLVEAGFWPKKKDQSDDASHPEQEGAVL
uniref:hypothetical protein n=1 Tax=Candidatus Fimivicinus sp. TaxID=3056640 RepID=UPI003FEFEB32